MKKYFKINYQNTEVNCSLAEQFYNANNCFNPAKDLINFEPEQCIEIPTREGKTFIFDDRSILTIDYNLNYISYTKNPDQF